MAIRQDARASHSQPASNRHASATRSKAVAEALPFLRRYAQALTGSPDSGDRYVRQFAKVFLSAPNALVAGDDMHLQCFVLFHEICRGLAPARQAAAAAGVGWIDREFASLWPITREVLLLVHLEGFPVVEAARIVGIPENDARDHLRKAQLAFRHAAPKFWLPAAAGVISYAPVDAYIDDSDAQDEAAAWRAARLMMARSSWPRATAQAPDGANRRDEEDGWMQQRQALEDWETEGGAAAPAIVL